MKVLFAPLGIASGIVAGLIARKAFERAWSLIDKEEPPDPKHRDISVAKMVAAMALEGVVFRATRGLVDHESRRLFARLTGTWPGEERPEPEA
jgi:hypothetical protein